MVLVSDDAAGRQTHLLRGVLEMAALAALATEPTHAYGLVDRLRGHGFTTVGYGTIYPLVTRLRRLGLVLQEPEPSPHGPPRNVLRPTVSGRDALAQWHSAWQDIAAATASVLDRAEPADHPAVTTDTTAAGTTDTTVEAAGVGAR